VDFNHSDGECAVRTQINFVDDTYFDYDVDYCKVDVIIIRESELLFK
jgi:hypothetical protein